MKSETLFIINWVDRMSEKYGGTVYSKDGKIYDWGQAICREQYGINWNKYIKENDLDDPDIESVKLASSWENGNIPEWVK